VKMLQRPLVDWIEHRTGLESAVKNFLFEEIPGPGIKRGGGSTHQRVDRSPDSQSQAPFGRDDDDGL
jgi:hypothetical protein